MTAHTAHHTRPGVPEMTTFQPGDIVDITIKGARIMAPKPGLDDVLTVGYEQSRPGIFHTIELTRPAADSVTVERIAPAEWPPRPGDLWRDKHGELWFVYTNPSCTVYATDDGALHGRTTGGKRWTDDAAGLIADNAPLTLVHREDPR